MGCLTKIIETPPAHEPAPKVGREGRFSITIFLYQPVPPVNSNLNKAVKTKHGRTMMPYD